MRESGELVVAAGEASRIGPRAENQDCAGVRIGTALERARYGVLAALADGVSDGRQGGQAATGAVRAAIAGFAELPDTLGPAARVKSVMETYNRWLYDQGRTEAMANSATTFTAMALRGRRAHVVHVGDSRAWRFSCADTAQGQLLCLTTDHTRREPDLRHVLIRALGMEQDVRLDETVIELAERDRLVLTSDGVHGPLSARRMVAILARQQSAQATAEALVDAALAAGGQDNATALVIDVISLPAPDHDGILAGLAGLPAIVPPAPGEVIDGFIVEQVLSTGRYAVLLVASDTESGARVVLKFPRAGAASERTMHLAFAREILIAQRISSPYVLAAHPVRPDRQTALYAVQPLLTGETMAARSARRLPTLPVALAKAICLTRAVAALHRLQIVHRDIKPDNVMLTDAAGDDRSGLKLIDFGVARLPRVEDLPGDEIPGTPGFMAPEQFDGNAGDMLTDQFALGVTLYRWFTGAMPFGEQEAFARPRFGTPTPLARHRPDMPSWLDDAICTAIQPDRTRRFGDVVELLSVLESGGPLSVSPQRPLPLIERYPVGFWQAISAVLAIALIASLVFHR